MSADLTQAAERAKACAERIMKCEPLVGVVGAHGDQDVWAEIPEAADLAALVLDVLLPAINRAEA